MVTAAVILRGTAAKIKPMVMMETDMVVAMGLVMAVVK